MEVVSVSFNAIFPLFCYMAIGYYLKYLKFLKEDTKKELNLLVFKIFLPVYVFLSIYNANFKAEFEPKTVFFTMGWSFFIMLSMVLIVPRIEKDRTIIPVMIQGVHKANFNLLVLPMIASIYGDNTGTAAILCAFVSPIANTFSTIVFEVYAGKEHNPRKLVIKVLKNPIVFAGILGITMNLLQIPLPKVIHGTVLPKLGAMATPLALIALGASFTFSNTVKYKKQLSFTVIGRLVASPLIAIPLAIAFGIRGNNLVTVGIYAAAPTAVNSYSTAVSMGGNEELANSILVLTSILSLLTMFLVFLGIGFTVGL
ncbi:MAG: AEC family transporter [Sphaerochaetaceae bacterium]|nr:AEC family transporter [Sphaerochaetaceae bacterium]